MSVSRDDLQDRRMDALADRLAKVEQEQRAERDRRDSQKKAPEIEVRINGHIQGCLCYMCRTKRYGRDHY